MKPEPYSNDCVTIYDHLYFKAFGHVPVSRIFYLNLKSQYGPETLYLAMKNVQP